MKHLNVELNLEIWTPGYRKSASVFSLPRHIGKNLISLSKKPLHLPTAEMNFNGCLAL